MAEILIKWEDSGAAFNYRKGDVIAICPNGWQWSNAEMTNPAWRIIKLPNIGMSIIEYLTSPDFNLDGTVKNKRGNLLDTTKLPGAVRNQINNNQVVTFNITGPEVLAWITKRS